MSTDLDSRLRSARASLRASVEHLEPGPLPAPGPARHPLVAAAAAVLVVAALVAAVAALRRDPESNVSTDPDEIPRLVLDESVVGLPATGAVELPVDGGAPDFPPIGVAVFEAPVGEGGVARIGVLSLDWPGGEGVAWEPEEGSEPVTVRGGDGWFSRDGVYGTSVAWEIAPGRIATVASRQLDRQQLLAAAEAGTVEDDRFSPGPVAAGLGTPEPLGRPGRIDMFSLAPLPEGAVGYGVAYQGEDDPDRVAFLSVVAATDDDVTALRWMTAADTPVEVRGHAGWMGTRSFATGTDEGSAGSPSGDDDAGTRDAGDDAGEGPTEPSSIDSHTVIWEEGPGVVAVLSATGFTTDDVLRLVAEGVGVASDPEWAALVEAADSPTPPDAEAAVASEAGGTEWSVHLADDGSLCASVQVASSSSESCSSPPGPADLLSGGDGTPLVVYGVLPPGAVEIEAPDGTPLGALTAPAEDGQVVYAIGLDDGPPPTEIVFVGADGSEVGRAPVGSSPIVEAESPTTVP